MEVRLQNSTILKDFRQKFAFESIFGSKTKSTSYPRNKFFGLDKRMEIVIEGQSSEFSIEKTCAKYGISRTTFKKWSDEFLVAGSNGVNTLKPSSKNFLDDEKHKIVLEGNNGEFSIAEICRLYGIEQDQFLSWSQEFLQIRNKRLEREKFKDVHTEKSRELILEHSNKEVLDYFESFIDVTDRDTFVSINSSDTDLFHDRAIRNWVSLKKINNVRHINKYFELINSILDNDSIFIGCLETFSARRKRKMINKFPVIGELYFMIEFLFKRILPKLSLTKKYYFNFTKGQDRLLSKAEGLGRLVSCGFKIMDVKNISGMTYFVVKKSSEPTFDPSPSYGPLYAMPRIGKDGKIIKVFKFRTMHPYSEYLQDYILRANGYAKSGKPAEDFRIPVWGKFMRKFWLDELPQLINVLKGDMKLVGVRPVSPRYFQDIPKEMQKLRLTQKPGCIPPYVSLNREGNVMSVLQAEREYLEDKLEHPILTDVKYFCKAVFNIIFHNKRSA